jgi:hypothetical protein
MASLQLNKYQLAFNSSTILWILFLSLVLVLTKAAVDHLKERCRKDIDICNIQFKTGMYSKQSIRGYRLLDLQTGLRNKTEASDRSALLHTIK